MLWESLIEVVLISEILSVVPGPSSKIWSKPIRVGKKYVLITKSKFKY